MEFASLEREIYVAASPEIVFDVVSRPEHIRQWWPDDARYEPSPGSSGEIVFGVDEHATVETFTVVDLVPPTRFVFRWTHPAGEPAVPGNSLLVTFELEPTGDGTTVRMTESGFREMGWETAVLEQSYADHSAGWTHYLPRLAPYAESLTGRP